MKKLYVILFSLFLLSFPAHAHIENDPLILINNRLKEVNMATEEWEVVVKEKITRNQADILLEQNDVTYTTTYNDQATIYKIKHQHDKHHLLKHIQLIVPHDGYATVQLMAVIKGNDFDIGIQSKYEYVKTFLNHNYFTDNARLFACIKVNSDAIISENGYFKKFQQIFLIQDTIVHEDSINEQNHYEILYGHTPLFAESIRVNDHSMNVHLVKRNQNQQETAFYIGTPILLNEY